MLTGDVLIAARSRASGRLRRRRADPDCGATWSLSHLLALKRAMGLMVTNRVSAAEEAERWGLVSSVVEDDELAAAFVTRFFGGRRPGAGAGGSGEALGSAW